MNCEEIELLIEALHDDDLEPRLKKQTEKHLSICESCKADFERLQKLSGMLHKSFVPAPPPSLDRNILQEFRLESARRQSPKISWRQKLFAGSIIIPKPLAAAITIVFLAALALSNFIGRSSSNVSDVAAVKNSSTSPIISSPSEKSNETKIIEVPVERERIVKQIVYVERQNFDSRKGNIRSNRKGSKNRRLNESLLAKRNAPNLEMKDSIAENGYFTRVNLSGFKPAENAKTRIIKETEGNEK